MCLKFTGNTYGTVKLQQFQIGGGMKRFVSSITKFKNVWIISNNRTLSMAEINERASVSQPSSPPPGPTHEISQLADEAHDKLAALLQSQIGSTVEEYKVIEEMNKVTAKRYEDMKVVAEGVGEKLKKLDITYESLRPYLRQVDELDEGTKRLEDALTKMENYVSNLEQKLSNLKQAREQRE